MIWSDKTNPNSTPPQLSSALEVFAIACQGASSCEFGHTSMLAKMVIARVVGWGLGQTDIWLAPIPTNHAFQTAQKAPRRNRAKMGAGSHCIQVDIWKGRKCEKPQTTKIIVVSPKNQVSFQNSRNFATFRGCRYRKKIGRVRRRKLGRN